MEQPPKVRFQMGQSQLAKLAGNEAANFLYPGKPNRNDKVVMEANRFKSIAGVFLLVSGH